MRLFLMSLAAVVGCSGAHDAPTDDDFSEFGHEPSEELPAGGSGGESSTGGSITVVEPSSGGASDTRPGTGGAILASGGEASTGGAYETGGATGVGGANAEPDASGGSPPVVTETILWSWSYSGFAIVAQGAAFVSARIILNGHTQPWDTAVPCPVSSGGPIVPGDSGEFGPSSTLNMDCVDVTLTPVAMFGDYEWETDQLPDLDYSDPDLNVRFILNSFTTNEWPVVGEYEAEVDFRWEIFTTTTSE